MKPYVEIEHRWPDKIIIGCAASPFFLLAYPGMFSVGLNVPTIISGIMLSAMGVALPMQLRFGPFHLFARLLMLFGSCGYLAAIFDKRYAVSMPIEGSGPVYFFIGLSGYIIYLHLQLKAERRNTARLIEKQRLLDERYDLEKPFHILNLLSNVVDLSAAEALKSVIKGKNLHRPWLISVPIQRNLDESLCTSLIGDADFFLIGITFTGFEFIIFDIQDIKEDAAKSMDRAKPKWLNAINEAILSQDGSKLNCLRFKGDREKLFSTNLSPESRFHEFIRRYVRKTWIHEQDDIDMKIAGDL